MLNIDGPRRECNGLGMSRKPRAPRRDAGRARGAPIVDAVLARTLEELAAHGHEGLSVERIAKSAQVNKTSVYRRWPTREALVAAALEGVLGSVSAQAPDTGSLRGDLLGLLAPVAALLEEPIGRAVLRAALAESTAGAMSAVAARQLETQTSTPVRALVARAKARGEWRAGVQGEQLMFLLVGALIHRALLEQQELSARWLTSLVDLVLGGVTPRGP
jgi:AcrR family transcriptional regulator